MTTMPLIEYDTFIGLQGIELYEFMEPVLADPTTVVSEEALDRMLRELDRYDEYHLVYALLLGTQHSLETFISHVPQYLTHRHASVRCTAYNILDRLPDRYITPNLVNAIRQTLASDDAKEFAADLLRSLEARLCREP